MKPSAAREARSPVLCLIWRSLSWLLGPLAYFGLLMAPFVLIGTMFKALHGLDLTGQQYWSFVAAAVLTGAWVARRLMRWIVYYLRQDVIDVDGIVGLLGTVVGLAASLWLFPPQ